MAGPKTFAAAAAAAAALLMAMAMASTFAAAQSSQLRKIKESLNITQNLSQQLTGSSVSASSPDIQSCKTNIQTAEARLTNAAKQLELIEAVDRRVGNNVATSATAERQSRDTEDIISTNNLGDKSRSTYRLATLSLVSARTDILSCRNVVSANKKPQTSDGQNSITSLLNELDISIQSAIYSPAPLPKSPANGSPKPAIGLTSANDDNEDLSPSSSPSLSHLEDLRPSLSPSPSQFPGKLSFPFTFPDGLPVLPPRGFPSGSHSSGIPLQSANADDDGFSQGHHLGMPLQSVDTEISDDASVLFAEGGDRKTFPNHVGMPLKFSDEPISEDGFFLQGAPADAPADAPVPAPAEEDSMNFVFNFPADVPFPDSFEELSP